MPSHTLLLEVISMKDIAKKVYRVFEKTGEPGIYMLYKALQDEEEPYNRE